MYQEATDINDSRLEGKSCSRCRASFPPEMFSRLKKARDGLHSWCKPCCAERRREDRALRPEHYSAIEARSYAKDRSGHLERQKERYWRIRAEGGLPHKPPTPEKRAAYNANRREKFSCPEAKRVKNEAQRAWRQNNLEKARALAKASWARKSPAQRLRYSFGAAISHAVKGRTKGGKSWTQLVGYGTEDLKAHLERQFLPGMSWDNYGQWHIDHIVPVASFQYESYDSEEFRRCWGLPNLRPLWAAENLGKRDKRIFLV